MATIVKFAIKDINPDRLRDEFELAVLVPSGILFAGFHSISNRLMEPFLTTEVIATHTGLPDTTAEPGELHLNYPSDPGAPLDTLLAAHNATNLSNSQLNEDRDAAAAIAHKNAFDNWDTLTAIQKDNANMQAQRSLARLFNSATDIE